MERGRLLNISVEGAKYGANHPPDATVPENSLNLDYTHSMLPELTHEEILRYSRHLLVPEVGLDGQRKLKAASVLIIGTGGLGSPAALYLAAAGIGRIGLVDYDVVERTNLQRQVIHSTSTVGQLKVESARERLLDLNPDIQVEIYNQVFNSQNAMEIARPYDLIIDGSDNFPTRYLTNDLCVLTGKPNVYGSVYRFEGQVSVFDARQGPCYRCLFPEPPPPGMVPSCAESGVLGILPGTIGSLQATEALKLILGTGEPLIGRLLLYNAADMSFEYVKLRKDPHCKVCGEHPSVTELIDYAAFCGVPGINVETGSAGAEWDISPIELESELRSGKRLTLLDVREPHELEISHIDGSQNIPLGQLARRADELDQQGDIVLICKAGERSTRGLQILLGEGFHKLRNLKGGMNAWVREIDPSQPIY
jgi:molybdopterin/thiamine biosynthesis adenylyltransferase/rhodanese-related sulfurtransferase